MPASSASVRWAVTACGAHSLRGQEKLSYTLLVHGPWSGGREGSSLHVRRNATRWSTSRQGSKWPAVAALVPHAVVAPSARSDAARVTAGTPATGRPWRPEAAQLGGGPGVVATKGKPRSSSRRGAGRTAASGVVQSAGAGAGVGGRLTARLTSRRRGRPSAPGSPAGRTARGLLRRKSAGTLAATSMPPRGATSRGETA